MQDAESMQNEVVGLFVSVLGRAPDRAALEARTSDLASGTIDDAPALARTLFASSEARAIFPENQGLEAIIGRFYENTLDRPPSAAEVDAVTRLVERVGGPNAIVRFLDAVLNADPSTPHPLDPRDAETIARDQTLLENRLAVAEHFAVAGPGTVDEASAVLEAVTPQTDTSSAAALDQFLAAALGTAGSDSDSGGPTPGRPASAPGSGGADNDGSPVDLDGTPAADSGTSTPKPPPADSIVLTDGDDVLNLIGGAAVNAGEAQRIDGGGGDDVLNVVDANTAAGDDLAVDIADGSVSNIETVNLDLDDDDDSVTFRVAFNAFPGSATILGDDGDTDDIFIAEGDAGDNTINLSGLTFEDTNGDAFEGAVEIEGQGGNDTLTATDPVTILDGSEGNDTLTGSSADGQTLEGGAGTDTLNAGSGGAGATGDTLEGGDGDDTLNGGADNDALDGGAGADTVNGGGGDDTITDVDTGGVDVIDAGASDDRLAVFGGAIGGSAQLMVGGTGSDDLLFGTDSGRDEAIDLTAATVREFEFINVGGAGSDADTVLIGSGTTIEDSPGVAVASNDTLAADTGSGDDTVDLSNVTAGSITGGGSYRLDSGDGDDTITGTNLADGNAATLGIATASFTGGAGDDTLSGGGGDDVIEGGTGSDTINGGADDDTLQGDAGSDTLNGGAGADTLFGGAGEFGVGDAEQSDADTLNGGDGEDTLVGNAGDDTLNGGAGVDTITGDRGADAIDFGGGSGDTLRYRDVDLDADPATGNVERFHEENTVSEATPGFSLVGVDRISHFDVNSDFATFDGSVTGLSSGSVSGGGTSDDSNVHLVQEGTDSTLADTSELLNVLSVIDELEQASASDGASDNLANLGDASAGSGVNGAGDNDDHQIFVIEQGESSGGTGNFGIYEYIDSGANGDSVDPNELSLIGIGSAGDVTQAFDAL